MPTLVTSLAAGVQTGGVPGTTFTKELLLAGKTEYGSAAAGSYQETSVNRPVWTCDAPSLLIAVYERHAVLGSTTLQIVHAIGSTPLGSSLPVLSTPMGGTTAVDVMVSGTLYNSTALTQFAVGDQAGVAFNTPGNLAPEGVVTLVLQRL